MTIPSFFIESASYSVDYEELHFLRNTVFIVEQQIAEEIEFDDLDPHCFHFIVRNAGYEPIATARLTPEGQLGRMAVLPQWRKQGVGASLIQALIDKARVLGLSEITAHAQVSALGFYEKQGFIARGDVFMEVGIPHRMIQRSLPSLEPSQEPAMTDRKPTVEATKLEGRDETVAATLQLIQQARRQLMIYTRDLDSNLYGQTEVVQALKQFVLANRQASVQILLQDPSAVQHRGHPLMGLVQRLPSFFLIRTPLEEEDLQYPSAFMVNDDNGYLFRLLSTRYEGHWSSQLSTQSRQLQENFDRIWQRSHPCTEFRALGL